MKTGPDLTPIVHSWLRGQGVPLPDDVRQWVVEQLPVTPQRAPRWPVLRLPHRIVSARWAALTVGALVIVAVIGLEVSPRPGSVVGQGTGPTPSPSPIVWSPASIEQDWPAPVRAEPAGDPVVVRWDDRYTDARGDIESSDVPWIDILDVYPGLCIQNRACVAFLVSTPPQLVGPDESWIAYGLVFDADLDGVADVRLGMDRVPADLTRRGLFPRDTNVRTWRTDLQAGTTEYAGGSACGCSYPGERSGVKAQISKQRAIPGRFYAWASVIEDGRVVATDYAPDRGWLEVAQPLPPSDLVSSDPSAGPTTR